MAARVALEGYFGKRIYEFRLGGDTGGVARGWEIIVFDSLISCLGCSPLCAKVAATLSAGDHCGVARVDHLPAGQTLAFPTLV
jgi:hypothetical protein